MNEIKQDTISKEQVLQYLENNKQCLFDICEKFDLKFPFSGRKELMEQYEFLKKALEYFEKSDKRTDRYYIFLIKLKILKRHIRYLNQNS